jgi:uncharacterized protein YecE (DUF72 family)
MIHVGTSGWQYDDWRGRFYPEGLAKSRWLAHYVSRFASVEVNNTFYRLPGDGAFERWRAASPPGFRWAVKASRYITHVRRLRDCESAVRLLWDRASGLGDALGPVLFQLPPGLRADLEVLRAFLSIFPPGMRAAFEFRDDSWRSEEVLAALDGRGAAWVHADRLGAGQIVGPTGGWGYVRFHQGAATHPAYGRARLRTWADRIAAWEVTDVFAYFNNDQLAAAPADAALLIELLKSRGCEVAEAGVAEEE